MTLKTLCSPILLTILALIGLAACTPAVPSPTATLPPTSTPRPTQTPSLTATVTPTPTASATPTSTFTPTPTPTPSETATPTPQPTYAVLRGFVNQAQVMCFYGPSNAYLFKYELIGGSRLEIIGYIADTGYIQVRAIGGTNPCWMNLKWMDVQGDINAVEPIDPGTIVLPGPSILYNRPAWVKAERNGNEVTVTWAAVPMTEDDDRGYLLDVYLCRDGKRTWTPTEMQNKYATTTTFTDEGGCSEPSGGVLYAVEKHGYTRFIEIPWPPAQ